MKRLVSFQMVGLALMSQIPTKPQAGPLPTQNLVVDGSVPSRMVPKTSEIEAFLKARASDITAGRKEPHSVALKTLATSQDVSEQMWALARLVEAGDLSAYPAYAKGMVEHVRGTVQPDSGLKDRKIPLLVNQEATRIAANSPFWKSLAKTLEEDPKAGVDAGLCAIWCYNTSPQQRPLIELVARRITSRVSLKSRTMDPWSDPRFWIVTDWAIAWGTELDFSRLEHLIQDHHAKQEFARRFKEIKKIQAFLPCLAENQMRDQGPAENPIPPAMVQQLQRINAATTLDFTNVKVKDRPPTPVYPFEAKARNLMAEMVLTMTVDLTGTPCMIRVQPGPFLAFFAPTCLEFSEGWRFQPAMLNGVPQYSRFRLALPFRLNR